MEHTIINDINLVIENSNRFIKKALISIQNINNDLSERYKESEEQLEKLTKEINKIPKYLTIFYDDTTIKFDEKKTFLIDLINNFFHKIFDPYLNLEDIIKKMSSEDIYQNKLFTYKKIISNVSSEIKNTRSKLIYKLVIEEFKTFFDHLVVNKIFPGNDKTKKVWKHDQNVSLVELGLQEINPDNLLDKITKNHPLYLDKRNDFFLLQTLVKKIKSYYTIKNVYLNEGNVVVKAEVTLEHYQKNDIKEFNHIEKDDFEFIIKGYLTEKEHHKKYLLELIDKFDSYYETTKTYEHLLFYDYEKIVTFEEMGIKIPENLPHDISTEMKIIHIDAMNGKLVVILKLTLDGKLAEQTKIIEISRFKKISQIWQEILESLVIFSNDGTPFDLESKVAYNSLWLDVINQINEYLIDGGFSKTVVNKITWKVKGKSLDEALNSCNDFVEKELKKEISCFLLDEKTTFNCQFRFINIMVKKWQNIKINLNFDKTVDNFYVGPTDSESVKEVRKTLIENFSEKFNSWSDFVKIYQIVQISNFPGYLTWQGNNIKYKDEDKYKFSLTKGFIGEKQKIAKAVHDLYTYKHCFSFDFTLHINNEDALEAVFIYWGKNENQIFAISAYFEKGLIEFFTK